MATFKVKQQTSYYDTTTGSFGGYLAKDDIIKGDKKFNQGGYSLYFTKDGKQYGTNGMQQSLWNASFKQLPRIAVISHFDGDDESGVDGLEFEPEHSNFLDDSISNFSISRTKKITPRVHGTAVDVNGFKKYKVQQYFFVQDSNGGNRRGYNKGVTDDFIITYLDSGDAKISNKKGASIQFARNYVGNYIKSI